MNTQGPRDNTPIDYDELITSLKKLIRQELGELMTGLLNNSGDRLFEMADNAPSNEDQNRLFEMMRLLKDIKPEIAAGFAKNLLHYLRPYEETEAEKSAQKLQAEGELSLVDTTQMEDMVLVKSTGERAAGMYREKITHLEMRLEHLALKTADIFAKDALKPVNLCQAFDDALGDYFDINAKKVLFGLLNEFVLRELDDFYDAMNNHLIEAGILPQIRLHAGPGGARRRGPVAGPRTGEPPQEEAQHYPEEPYYPQGDYPGGYAGGDQGGYGGGAPAPGGGSPGGFSGGAPAPGGGAPGGGGSAPGGGGGAAPGMAPAAGAQPHNVGDYAMTAPPGGFGGGAPMPPGSASAAGQQAPAGAPPAPAGGYSDGTQFAKAPEGYQAGTDSGSYNYPHTTAGMPASQVSQAVGSFIGAPVAPGHAGSETLPDGSPNPAFPASTPQYFGHQEILNALSNIQTQPQFVEPQELRFDSEAIKQAVISSIAKESGGVVTKRMNQIAEKTIDFIELVFDAIIDDKEISDTIKALLLRLQIPVIKASMLDSEFFIYDDHPARVLLDKIAEAGVGVTEHTDEVYIRLEKVVSSLVNDYELQTSTFQAALDKINAFLEEREAIARAKEEEAQQQALREHARNAVLTSLRTITTGKNLPEAVHPLVLKRWPTLMFNHYIEHGKENDEWITIIEILRDIIDSVQPFKSVEDLAYLKQEKDELEKRVRYYMERTYKSQKDIDQVIKGMTDTHDEMIEDNDFPVPQIEMAEQTVAETGPREKVDVKTMEQRKEPTPLPSNIMPGMWFEVYIDDDTPCRRLKLSVIIVEESKLVFVNHSGELVIEKQIEDFARDIDEGRSKVIMGHSVFDHALSSVITRMQPQGGPAG